jgi:hypothetical protein
MIAIQSARDNNLKQRILAVVDGPSVKRREP